MIDTQPYAQLVQTMYTSSGPDSAAYAAQMREAHAQGQRDMREAAAKVCADLEYTGWNGEYMQSGPETDANEEFRKCAAVILALPINAEITGLSG